MKHKANHYLNKTDQNNSKNSSMYFNTKQQVKFPQNFSQFVLCDYTFLQDYQLIESPLNRQNTFLAKIRDTSQTVKFKKIQYISIQTPKGLTMWKRFQVLVKLFQKGNIIADNIFILQENDKHFYYIIEPYLKGQIDETFVTLQQYLYENRCNLSTFQSKLTIFNKCKILLDNLSQFQVNYYGLNTKSILIDDQNNFYLMPYELDPIVENISYKRSYYPPQILQMLTKNHQQQKFLKQSFQKWDIWSFGCITLEIFFYLTPYFLSFSVENQFKKCQSFFKQLVNIFNKQYEKQIQELSKDKICNQMSLCIIGEKIINKNDIIDKTTKILSFLFNTLQFQLKNRSISFQANEQFTNKIKTQIFKEKNNNQRKIFFQKRSYSTHNSNNSKVKNNQKKLTPRFLDSKADQFKELNIFDKILQQFTGEYNFELRIISLSNIQNLPNSSLKVKFRFSQSYEFTFFLDIKDNNNSNSCLINRKITFKQKSINFFSNLLQNDLEIIICQEIIQNQHEQDYNSIISINLGALTLIDNGKRIWKKPIQGNYQAKNGYFNGYRFKIKCEITNPKQNQKQYQQQPTNINSLKNSKNIKYSNQIQQISPIKNLPQRVALSQKDSNIQIYQQNNVRIKKSKNFNIEKISQKRFNKRLSAFSQINNQIDQVSSYWKAKVNNQEAINKKSINMKDQSKNKQNKISSRIQQILSLN